MVDTISLPKEWIITSLGKIARWGSGGTPSRKNSNFYNGDIPWIKTGDLGKRVVTQASEFITNEAIKNSSAKYFPKGSVAIAMYGATIGKTSILGIDATTNQACGVGQPIEGISTTDYLYFLICNEKYNFIAKGKGGAQPNISQAIIKSHKIPFPSLAEQKEIVVQLDKLLTQVDNLKKHLDSIPELLKYFRQSVLAAAVSGKLTEEWRIENKPRKSVSGFKNEITQYRYDRWIHKQEEKFNTKGKWPKTDNWKNNYIKATLPDTFEALKLPDGWVYEPLDGLVYIAARIGWKGLKASEYTNDGPLFLSVHSLNYGQHVKLSEAFHISQERYFESPEIILQNDDILLCKDGAGIGKISIVKNLSDPATINSSLLLIRSGRYFISEYLYYFLAGPAMQKLVQERMTGTAVPHLFQRDVKEFVLEVPPIEEQTEIINRVEALFAFADKIEQHLIETKNKVNKLTPSLLAKAFRGDLTADWRKHNNDLITGNNSAKALLEGIKIEQKKLQPKRNTLSK